MVSALNQSAASNQVESMVSLSAGALGRSHLVSEPYKDKPTNHDPLMDPQYRNKEFNHNLQPEARAHSLVVQITTAKYAS